MCQYTSVIINAKAELKKAKYKITIKKKGKFWNDHEKWMHVKSADGTYLINRFGVIKAIKESYRGTDIWCITEEKNKVAVMAIAFAERVFPTGRLIAEGRTKTVDVLRGR